jgi:hypothetical protein
MQIVKPFDEEQVRVLVNLRQHYEVWMEAERSLARLPYGMVWKTVSGKDYLYETRDRRGNGRSLGPRGPATEEAFLAYQSSKAKLRAKGKQSWATLERTCRLYRALRLPMIDGQAAVVLRELDRRNLLGSHLLVVGTNAMPAYAVEAAGRIGDAPDQTDDFDIAWTARPEDRRADDPPVMLWSALKAADATYTVNSERSFQARNAKAYEVVFLVAPSRASGLNRKDQPKPVPSPEQEWLLLGVVVDQVVVARNATPARIVSPDPRWFALHKLWMADQAKGDPLKRGKDRAQGEQLLRAIDEAMPRFPIDQAFLRSVPEELRCYIRSSSDAG